VSDAKETLLTAAAIAKELGVSDAKVKKAIKELAIEPVAKKGVCSYYGPDALTAIRAKI
jgi:biotin operon repressor